MMSRDLGYRKIQCTGRSSYIISLPKEWVSTTKLEKGSELAFKVQEDSSLLLVPRKILEKREVAKSTLKEHTLHITSSWLFAPNGSHTTAEVSL